MASWKENGEVPDSDDEWDFESQNTAPAGVNIEDGLVATEQQTRHEGDDAEEKTNGSLELVSEHKKPEIDDIRDVHQDEIRYADKLAEVREAARPTTTSSQSSYDIDNFKIQALPERNSASAAIDNSTSRTVHDIPAKDDISRTYVQITSPVETSFSSPEDGLPSLDDLRRQVKRNCNKDLYHDQASERQIHSSKPDEIGIRPKSPVRRALRHRNAIQLHPYVVEQEKYRRTLKSRGIAPMRLASSQAEEPRTIRKSTSPDPDFQDLDTQPVEADTMESQPMDFDWDTPLSSSPLAGPAPMDVSADSPATPINQDDVNDFPDDDDELPNIDELLHSRSSVLPKKKPQKSRVKSYSNKFKRPTLPRILREADGQRARKSDELRIFDVPASPPETSSPHPTARLIGHSHRYRGGSRPLERSPSWLSHSELSAHADAELPTPATSAVKPHAPDPVSLLSDSELSDAAGNKESDSALSSSDESLQIRKISKKFRGVLPASHLRLDQHKKQQNLKRNHQNDRSRSVSPAKSTVRRGVALPRVPSGTYGTHKSPHPNAGLEFDIFSDESDDGGDGKPPHKAQTTEMYDQMEDLFPDVHTGSADEDDRVDAMLPTGKRRASSMRPPYKKRRYAEAGIDSIQPPRHTRQPKITEHLDHVLRSVPKSSRSKNSRRSKAVKLTTSRRPAPPRLGILDVLDTDVEHQSELPNFIRIAARTTRSKSGHGRHEPGGKYLRLSTREDTEDVQSVLQKWTAGKIQPQQLLHAKRRPEQLSKGPLHQVQDNFQTKFEPTLKQSMALPPARALEAVPAVRKLLVSRRQISMRDFVRTAEAPAEHLCQPFHYQIKTKSNTTPQGRARFAHHESRPAQLEEAEIQQSRRHPSTTFKSTKRALDSLYRGGRRPTNVSPNLVLNRFLADEDIVRPSVETASGNEAPQDVRLMSKQEARAPWRQKRNPRRLDIGAAVYRQPSNPLITNQFSTDLAIEATSEFKLLGLAKFGTRYTQHFNILPLPSGTFFHSSTFVGSGRLSKIMRDGFDLYDRDVGFSTPIVVSLNLAKSFSWETWDQNISSEVGLCFDWLADQLQADETPASDVGSSVIDVATALLDYVEQSDRLVSSSSMGIYMARMLEVLRDFSSRIRFNKYVELAVAQIAVPVLSRICALAFRLVGISKKHHEHTTSSLDFEDLLKILVRQCAQILVSQDFDILRKLYDDLQYLSYRDEGIKNSQCVVEAWVTLIQLLNAAKMPRGSFWDLVSPLLISDGPVEALDAPSMEKMWYTMYSLLPLCEFDKHGVVIPGSRHSALFDNWHLPQHFLKRIFSLYKINPRQPPGFNEYCRSIVARCHYLMVEWGWWKCGAVIGVLFDFFASQNLAHLRNEEVYASPRFLSELQHQPSLAIEPEDRCFHIFLKFVALALQHLAKAHDIKTVANLVARLLPNHNRQYPKDEAIRQADLASLRNHHDLLCTLFWAAPVSQRPSIAILEHLVERGHSHKEAFLIHVRARGYLANFLLSAHSERITYKALEMWLTADLNSLLAQYEGVEEETRGQGAGISAVTETDIQSIITSNRDEILTQILLVLVEWCHEIQSASTIQEAMQAFDPDLLIDALDGATRDTRSSTNGLLCQCVKVIEAYINKVQVFSQASGLPIEHPAAIIDNDSQESGWDESAMALSEAVADLDKFHGEYSALLQGYLERKTDTRIENLLRCMVVVWARIATLFTETDAQKAQNYVKVTKFSVFKNRDSYEVAKKYWPLFLAEVIRHGDHFWAIPFKIVFNIELEWMLVLIDPYAHKEFEDELTAQMIARPSYLATGVQVQQDLATKFQAITATMNRMTRVRDKHADVTETKNLFKHMLITLELQIIARLHEMQLHGTEFEHKAYTKKIEGVMFHIHSSTTPFHTVSYGLSTASAFYPSSGHDPALMRPKLKSYADDLDEDRGAASPVVFYYLYYRWLSHAQDGRVDSFVEHLNAGKDYWPITRFILEDFLPVVLLAALDCECWPLIYHIIRGVKSHIIKHLYSPQNKDSSESVEGHQERLRKGNFVFEKLLNLFKIFLSNLSRPQLPMATYAVIQDLWLRISLHCRRYIEWPSGQKYEEELQTIGRTLNRLNRHKHKYGSWLEFTYHGGMDEDERSEQYKDDLHREPFTTDLGTLDVEAHKNFLLTKIPKVLHAYDNPREWTVRVDGGDLPRNITFPHSKQVVFNRPEMTSPVMRMYYPPRDEARDEDDDDIIANRAEQHRAWVAAGSRGVFVLRPYEADRAKRARLGRRPQNIRDVWLDFGNENTPLPHF